MPTMKNTITIATVDTPSFKFTAVGKDEPDARKALQRGWEAHCREYVMADKHFLGHIEDEIAYVTLAVGQCWRHGDDAPLPTA